MNKRKVTSETKKNMSLQKKLLIVFLITAFTLLSVNIFLYLNINHMISKISEVYLSNVSLNELELNLDDVQDAMTLYLNTKSSDALEEYYRSSQSYELLITKLNDTISDNTVLLTEKNIRNLSDKYLSSSYETVQAKRGRNIERYKEYYEISKELHDNIKTFISSLNNVRFKNNLDNYEILLSSLKYMEIISSIIVILVGMLNIVLITTITKTITNPLNNLAKAAEEVAAGYFDVGVPELDYMDEVGVVTKAFNKMLLSIQAYIKETKVNMERESRLINNELIMQRNLKEAQLKYIQAQIDPHFLFNTINAGVQLAMMEGAGKTSLFLEHMAAYYRYNLRKSKDDNTIEEEIRLVDSYIHIINVRFSGDITFMKDIDERLLDTKVPSMILQPLVENAVKYGVRGISWPGMIEISIYKKEESIVISVWDNGKGMKQEIINEVLNKHAITKELGQQEDSNGIGLVNVIERIELYFMQEGLVQICSDGENKGTEILIQIPIVKGEEENV